MKANTILKFKFLCFLYCVANPLSLNFLINLFGLMEKANLPDHTLKLNFRCLIVPNSESIVVTCKFN